MRPPAAVCAIRGTEFGVEHDAAGGETTAGVFDEGSLSVSSLDQEGKTTAEGTVEKGDEVSLRAGARELKPGRMRRLMRHRKALLGARGRLDKLGRNWKRLTHEKREELRKRFMQRKAFRGQRAKRGAARAQGPGKEGKPGMAPRPEGERGEKTKKRAPLRRAVKNRRDGNR